MRSCQANPNCVVFGSQAFTFPLLLDGPPTTDQSSTWVCATKPGPNVVSFEDLAPPVGATRRVGSFVVGVGVGGADDDRFFSSS